MAWLAKHIPRWLENLYIDATVSVPEAMMARKYARESLARQRATE